MAAVETKASRKARFPKATTIGSIAKEPLQVRIPVAVKRRFKSHAALRGIEPNVLFVEVWEFYESRLPPRSASADKEK